MSSLIPHVQAMARLKSGIKGAPSQQQHIHYFYPDHDKRFVSHYTEAVLREMMQAAAIGDIWITSTVRDTREQAGTMLQNLQSENALKARLAAETDAGKRAQLEKVIHKSHVGYKAPGTAVLKVASASIASGDDDDAIVEKMMRSIQKVGLAKVTQHAATSGHNTVDISCKMIVKSYGQAGYTRFVGAIKSYVNQGRVARFGWPSGPNGGGRLFHDGKCMHIEVNQPLEVDGPTSTKTMVA